MLFILSFCYAPQIILPKHLIPRCSIRKNLNHLDCQKVKNCPAKPGNSDCRQNGSGCIAPGTILNFIYKYIGSNIQTKEQGFLSPPFLHFQIASFFRFIHANKRVSSIVTFANPLYCVYLIPCFSFPSAKTRSMVSFRF